MKYKGGDKVKIKSKEELSNSLYATDNMLQYAGREAVISCVETNNKMGRINYRLDIDHGVWIWSGELFEENYVPEQDDKVIEYWCKVDSFADDMLKSIFEMVDKHSFNVKVRKEGNSVILTPIEKKEEELPIDTPVMVGNKTNEMWCLGYYAYKGKVFLGGITSKYQEKLTSFDYIIPFDKFNPDNIEESLKYNIVK